MEVLARSEQAQHHEGPGVRSRHRIAKVTLASDTTTHYSSYWRTHPSLDPERGDLPEQADVAVVGAGYTGLLAALTLARRGRSVVLFASGELGGGAATLNAGIVAPEVPIPAEHLIARYGIRHAAQIAKEAVVALGELQHLILEEGIQCNLIRSGCFVAATSTAGFRRLAAQASRDQDGDEGIRVIDRGQQATEIVTDAFFGGQVRTDVWTLNPGRLHAQLALLALRAGVCAAPQTRVEGIEHNTRGLLVRSARGTIAVRDVIVATNAFTDSAFPWLRQRLRRTWSHIIVTPELPREALRGIMPGRRVVVAGGPADTYFRLTPDEARLVFGGSAPRHATLQQAADILSMRLNAIFPSLSAPGVDYAWSGPIAMTRSGLPEMGGHGGIQYAISCLGGGLVWGPYLGKRMAHALLGLDSETVFRVSPSLHAASSLSG